jgi:hypothetical protein
LALDLMTQVGPVLSLETYRKHKVLLRQELDELYTGFCDDLPAELRACAQDLPYLLRMAPLPGTPWSEVFGHEVTFAAPALFAEAMPHIARAQVREAMLAHALAVIDAFGTDRMEDSQIPRSYEIRDLIVHLRAARDRALSRVASDKSEVTTFAVSHARMIAAVRAEGRVFGGCEPADFSRYERIAAGKTSIGLPASVALAQAAGFSEAECRAVGKTLESIWLGMQYHDDVVDWEDDFRRGSAWAVHLARSVVSEVSPRAPRPTERNPVRDLVLESGVLSHMLERSFRHFRAARKRGEALGVTTLCAWAQSKEDHAKMLALHERQNAGYALRMHALSPWAARVLS